MSVLGDSLNELDGRPFNRAVLGWKTELPIPVLDSEAWRLEQPS